MSGENVPFIANANPGGEPREYSTYELLVVLIASQYPRGPPTVGHTGNQNKLVGAVHHAAKKKLASESQLENDWGRC